MNERLKLGDNITDEQREALLSLFVFDDDAPPPTPDEEALAGLLAGSAFLYATEVADAYKGMDQRGKTDTLLREAFPMYDTYDSRASKEGITNLGYSIPNFDHLEDDPDWDGTISPNWNEMTAWQIYQLQDWDTTREIPHDEVHTGDMMEGVVDSALKAEERVKLAIRSWLGMEDTSEVPGLKWMFKHQWESEEEDYFAALMAFESDDDEEEVEADPTPQIVYDMILRFIPTEVTVEEIVQCINDWTDLDDDINRPMWAVIWGDGKKLWGTEVEFITAMVTDLRNVSEITYDICARVETGSPLIETPLTRGVEDEAGLDLQVQATLLKSIYEPTGPCEGHDWYDKQRSSGEFEPSFTLWRQSRRDERFLTRMAKILHAVKWTGTSEKVRARCNRISEYCRSNHITKYAEHTVIAMICELTRDRAEFAWKKAGRAFRPYLLMAFYCDIPRYRKDKEGHLVLVNPWIRKNGDDWFTYNGFAPLSSTRVYNQDLHLQKVTHPRQAWWVGSERAGSYYYAWEDVESMGTVTRGRDTTITWRKTLPHSTYTTLKAGWVRNNKMMPYITPKLRGLKPSLIFKEPGTYDDTHSGGIALGVEWYLRAYVPSTQGKGKLASNKWQQYCKRLITTLVGYANDYAHKREMLWELADSYYGYLIIHGRYNKLG